MRRSVALPAVNNAGIFGIIVSIFGFVAPLPALTITAVEAPNLDLPNNGTLYDFKINVSGTYGKFDFNTSGTPLVIMAQYYDADSFIFDFLNEDDPIDTTRSFMIAQAPPANNSPFGPVEITFQCGCKDNSVFGPSSGTDTTGESVMDDGYFYFPEAINSYWGYNTVRCRDIEMPDVGNSSELKKVPEPASFTLLICGAAMLMQIRKRATFH
jgi:hypothetical protein